MTNYILRFLSLPCICAVFLLIGVTDTFAYTTWDNETYPNGCINCHPGFRGESGGSLHILHLALNNDDCFSCHTYPVEDETFTRLTPYTPTGTGCAGCHGRSEDTGDGVDFGVGLRQHHVNAGTTICDTCHWDSFPTNYTPVGEDVPPPFYPFFDPLALDPCNDGLDNDGDLLYDGDDPDCGLDIDNDGILNAEDNCPNAANPNQADSDGDGIGDACVVDNDNDGVLDDDDNCPSNCNSGQLDADGDGIGDVCDETPGCGESPPCEQECDNSPTIPELISPDNGTEMDNGRLNGLDSIDWSFSWSPIAGAEKYNLFVKHTGSELTLIDNSDITDTTYDSSDCDDYIIEVNRFNWFWKVRAYKDGQWRDWSEIRYFNVEPLDSDAENENCECVPITIECSFGSDCGEIDDGCGGIIDCGLCPAEAGLVCFENSCVIIN